MSPSAQRTDEYSFDGLTLYDTNALNAAFVDSLSASNGYLILQMLFQGFLICQLLYACFPMADGPPAGVSVSCICCSSLCIS